MAFLLHSNNVGQSRISDSMLSKYRQIIFLKKKLNFENENSFTHCRFSEKRSEEQLLNV